MKKHTRLAFDELDRFALLAIGFRKWDESGLMLVPIGLVKHLAVGTVLHGIDGKKTVTVGRDEIDLDTRYGCIAFGVFCAEDVATRERGA